MWCVMIIFCLCVFKFSLLVFFSSQDSLVRFTRFISSARLYDNSKIPRMLLNSLQMNYFRFNINIQRILLFTLLTAFYPAESKEINEE